MFHIFKYYRSGIIAEVMNSKQLQLFYQIKHSTKQIILTVTNLMFTGPT